MASARRSGTGRATSRRLDEPARRRLLRRYALDRRPEDLEALVLSYRPLACSLARRYATAADSAADVEQAACEGLVKAIRRFDTDHGAAFTSFAVPTILGEIRRHLRDTTWPAHVPRTVQERIRRVRAASERFAASAGRPPTVGELVDALGETEEDTIEALVAARSYRMVPLDGERTDEEGVAVADRVGEDDPGFERVECLTAIARALPKLDATQQLVVRLHFLDGLSQRQIAGRVGFSRSQVGRVLEAALERLRAETAAMPRVAA